MGADSDGDSSFIDYENLRSAQCMSDFHWSTNFTETPPWKETTECPTVMALFGTIKKKTEYSKMIRPFLASKCKSYGTDCSSVMDSHMSLFNKKRHTKIYLEPPGDSPLRRSISESLLAGCIPVMFSGQTNS